MAKKAKVLVGPEVGQVVFIRAVPFFYVGRISVINADWIGLTDAAWVADTGRFHEAMASGNFSEVEPYGNGSNPVFVSRSCIADVSIAKGALPYGVK